MHRKNLLKLLGQYVPDDPNEIIFKEKMFSFIQENNDCFQRSLEYGHITGSCWLLNHTNDKALLLHHTKLDRWFQLGGHCDGDSNVLEVAIKEAQEESGIMDIVPVLEGIFDLDIHLIPANHKDKAHYHYDIRFLLKVTKDLPTQANIESKALKWISKNIEDLPTDNISVVRMFNKWLAL